MAATSQRWQSEVLKIQGSPPGLRNIDYSNFVAANPWFKAFSDAANAPQTISFAPDGAETFGPEVIKIVGTRFDQMLFGDSEPEVAAQAMQKDLESLIAARKQK
ncbi:hypothetical protein [Mesorhizobium sp.]|uniref:hypothetical protein n=1 Tax=Mesorhizobium sp. TaxID=1871066 RepID=UPI00122AA14F|nr:hypothetical protein [Mesorhizobium sp.]TIV62366.1 MAG: hypothetical protein E5V80_00415 [Mesorhizobium sp.]